MNHSFNWENTIFPLKHSPLIHCITNEISIHFMANVLLSIHAKPVMAEDCREVAHFVKQSDALLLNTGRFSVEKEKSMHIAMCEAKKNQKPIVLDIVGYTVSPIRQKFCNELLTQGVTVLKGNISEMRTLCGLPSRARGVDRSLEDATQERTEEFIHALLQKAKLYENTVFLATGVEDIIVHQSTVYILKNGHDYLDQITGTGDVVGALICACLSCCENTLDSVITSVSYLNRCAELADKSQGLESFQKSLLDQLSLQHKSTNWQSNIKGEFRCYG